MLLDKKTLLKIWLNPGLNLTIFSTKWAQEVEQLESSFSSNESSQGHADSNQEKSLALRS